MSNIDLCIVSGRRPELLEKTLKSFTNRVFSKIAFASIFVNIDPIFGSDDDHAACISVVRTYFPNAIIFEPDAPQFCAAVARLWSASKSEYIMHLEDDWVALIDMGPELLDPFAIPSIMQVSLHTAQKCWNISKKGHFHTRKNRFRLLGMPIPFWKSYFPEFTTSPSILRGSFARHCASLMDLSRDPEKQFTSTVNPPLRKYVAHFKNYIFSPEGQPVVFDIGRDWRETRGISKKVSDSISTWHFDVPAAISTFQSDDGTSR